MNSGARLRHCCSSTNHHLANVDLIQQQTLCGLGKTTFPDLQLAVLRYSANDKRRKEVRSAAALRYFLW